MADNLREERPDNQNLMSKMEENAKLSDENKAVSENAEILSDESSAENGASPSATDDTTTSLAARFERKLALLYGISTIGVLLASTVSIIILCIFFHQNYYLVLFAIGCVLFCILAAKLVIALISRRYYAEMRISLVEAGISADCFLDVCAGNKEKYAILVQLQKEWMKICRTEVSSPDGAAKAENAEKTEGSETSVPS